MFPSPQAPRSFPRRGPLALAAALALAPAAAALLAPGPAAATVVVAMGLGELTATSSVVVRARVTEVRQLTAAEAEGLWVRATFEPLEVLKAGPDAGSVVPGGRISVDVVGGERDGRAVRIPGVPGFAVGEEVVVFLERTSRGFIYTGLAQGVFRVTRGPEGAAVRRSTAGLTFAVPGRTGDDAIVPPPPAVDGYPLDALLAEIRHHVDAGPAKGPVQP